MPNNQHDSKIIVARPDSAENAIDSSLLESYNSFYGFIVKNPDNHDFYCVDEKIMNKYISNNQFDSIVIMQDFVRSNWYAPIIGSSYDYFTWLNYIERDSSIENIDIQICEHEEKSQIVPVYITQFNRRISDLVMDSGHCSDLFPSEIYRKASLNLVNVIPLNNSAGNNFLNMRDTLSREKYQSFLENRIH